MAEIVVTIDAQHLISRTDNDMRVTPMGVVFLPTPEDPSAKLFPWHRVSLVFTDEATMMNIVRW